MLHRTRTPVRIQGVRVFPQPLPQDIGDTRRLGAWPLAQPRARAPRCPDGGDAAAAPDERHPEPDLPFALALVALIALAATVSWLAHLRVGRDQVTAAVRACLQLAAVALVVGAVLRSVVLAALFVVVMLVVAGATSTRRIGAPFAQLPWVVAALAAGVAPVVGIALGFGVLPLNALGLLPFAGIVIGGAMTSATLTGRRACQELEEQRTQYEAALALGLPTADAAAIVLEPHASEGLVPGLDQTRTVGLVTLPGAFIGVLLGGGSAVEAAAAQLLVLIGLLAAQAVTAAVVLRLVATRRVLRRDLEIMLAR